MAPPKLKNYTFTKSGKITISIILSEFEGHLGTGKYITSYAEWKILYGIIYTIKEDI